jgi:transcriptional regulator
VEIPIDKLVGKWKMSQNRSAADQQGVVTGLLESDEPQAAAVAGVMRGLHA